MPIEQQGNAGQFRQRCDTAAARAIRRFQDDATASLTVNEAAMAAIERSAGSGGIAIGGGTIQSAETGERLEFEVAIIGKRADRDAGFRRARLAQMERLVERNVA